uniref:Titin n=1 Tax=Hucho hucho TaxID=62062 RepID=A0A4W5MPV4_9TELE
ARNAVGTVSPPSQSSGYVMTKDESAVPEAPGTPDVTDSSKSSVTLEWIKPVFDGGMEIIGYIIEMCKTSLNEWHQVNRTTCINTTYTAKGLMAGEEYRFRVRAVNGSGKGEACAIPNPVQAVDRLTSPEITLDADFKQTHVVKNGATVTLHIAFCGKPSPLATWTKASGELGVMTDVNTTDTCSTLTIESCTRYDSGKYTLSLENNGGRKSITFTVKVLDTPGPPGAISFKDVTRGALTMLWDAPANDGGARIQHYIVEKREASRLSWKSVSEKSSRQMIRMTNLDIGVPYLFRVTAENMYGRGEPSSVVIKEPKIEPTADLSGITNQLITCKTHDAFTIDIPISGRPAPKATWKLEEMKLKETDRVIIKTTTEKTTLVVKDSKRADSGKYYLTLDNQLLHGVYHSMMVAARLLDTLWSASHGVMMNGMMPTG